MDMKKFKLPTFTYLFLAIALFVLGYFNLEIEFVEYFKLLSSYGSMMIIAGALSVFAFILNIIEVKTRKKEEEKKEEGK